MLRFALLKTKKQISELEGYFKSALNGTSMSRYGPPTNSNGHT